MLACFSDRTWQNSMYHGIACAWRFVHLVGYTSGFAMHSRKNNLRTCLSGSVYWLADIYGNLRELNIVYIVYSGRIILP